MRERFRTFDSKISFFAFADIITAVSGMLVFITLLLATDLGRPVIGAARRATSEIQQQLQQSFEQQADADAQIARLQALLASAERAPDSATLQSEIANLRAQLAVEENKEAALGVQISANQANVAARDQALGLTDLKETIARTFQDVESLADAEKQARDKAHDLDQQAARVESQLVKLRQREGQIWLIPDRTLTTKEPILVTVTGAGISIERFNRPNLREDANASGASDAFATYLSKAHSTNQYVVFLIKPSGIATFRSLVLSARDMGFDVGYDALAENQQVHFSTPPPIDEAMPTEHETVTTAPGFPNHASGAAAAGGPGHSPGAGAASPKPGGAQSASPAQAPPPQPKPKSWWERLLEWLGLE